MAVGSDSIERVDMQEAPSVCADMKLLTRNNRMNIGEILKNAKVLTEKYSFFGFSKTILLLKTVLCRV